MAKNQLEVWGEGQLSHNDQRSCLDKYSSPHSCLYLHRALEAVYTQYRAAQTMNCLLSMRSSQHMSDRCLLTVDLTTISTLTAPYSPSPLTSLTHTLPLTHSHLSHTLRMAPAFWTDTTCQQLFPQDFFSCCVYIRLHLKAGKLPHPCQ